VSFRLFSEIPRGLANEFQGIPVAGIENTHPTFGGCPFDGGEGRWFLENVDAFLEIVMLATLAGVDTLSARGLVTDVAILGVVAIESVWAFRHGASSRLMGESDAFFRTQLLGVYQV
jgi:hypothetical protein